MNIPTAEHFAVVYTDSIFIPGDERSRTNSGHGYPDSWETRQVYKAFQDQTALEAWIASNSKDKTDFVVLKAQPLMMDTKVTYSFRSAE
jgi:hypothetical protein